MSKDDLEAIFLEQWLRFYPEVKPEREFQFHSKRKWRFDFAWPAFKVAVEVQGMGPGHCSLQGMTSDYNKHHEALLLGWTVVHLTREHLASPETHTKLIATFLGLSPRSGYVPVRRKRGCRP